MTLVSYAQNREDVVLDRAFPRSHRGFYIDVGASDPVVDSVTKHFYDRGWHGINVEPARIAFGLLQQARPRDINLNVGLAASPGTATFYELPRQLTGCSTFSEHLADQFRDRGSEVMTREVDVLTLASLCETHVGQRAIDFLKIDVEGDERDVLRGADLGRFRPRVIVVEATRPGTAIQSHESWEPSLLDAGFEFALFDGLNRFYARVEEPALKAALGAPANVFDDYIVHTCLQWKQEAARSEAARAEAQRARAELAAVERRSAAALQGTRRELAASQAALRDARAELAEVRRALTLTLAGAD